MRFDHALIACADLLSDRLRFNASFELFFQEICVENPDRPGMGWRKGKRGDLPPLRSRIVKFTLDPLCRLYGTIRD